MRRLRPEALRLNKNIYQDNILLVDTYISIRYAYGHSCEGGPMRLSSFEPGDGKVLAQAVRGRRRGHAERRGRLSGPASGTDRA